MQVRLLGRAGFVLVLGALTMSGAALPAQASFAFRDASYGYLGEYVDQSEYNHYFREGFRRGYEDGFNSRNRYGRSSNGRYELTSSLMSQIIDLQPLSPDD